MTRGFEHRLWGYTVVRIRQPDTERGVGSDPSSSVRHLSSSSSSTSLVECQEMGEYGKLGVVEVPDEGPQYPQGQQAQQQKINYSNFDNGDLAMRPRPESRDGSEEMDDHDESLGRWQIPETVLLTSESIGPF